MVEAGCVRRAGGDGNGARVKWRERGDLREGKFEKQVSCIQEGVARVNKRPVGHLVGLDEA